MRLNLHARPRYGTLGARRQSQGVLMRGTILGFDPGSGEGVINDTAGTRFKFSRDDWKGPGDPTAGRVVDFDIAGDRATDIYVVPGTGSPIDFTGQSVAQSAMTAGIISLVCAVLSFVLGPFGIFTLVASVIFGIKGKNAGRDLPDKTAYYLSIAGLAISAVALLIVLLALAACVGMVGILGTTGALMRY
jgi:hypothetical protein